MLVKFREIRFGTASDKYLAILLCEAGLGWLPAAYLNDWSWQSQKKNILDKKLLVFLLRTCWIIKYIVPTKTFIQDKSFSDTLGRKSNSVFYRLICWTKVQCVIICAMKRLYITQYSNLSQFACKMW